MKESACTSFQESWKTTPPWFAMHGGDAPDRIPTERDSIRPSRAIKNPSTLSASDVFEFSELLHGSASVSRFRLFSKGSPRDITRGVLSAFPDILEF